MIKKSVSKIKAVKGWAVCFALNKKCLTGDFCAFNRRKNAKTYIKKLHEKIGGFEEDHHLVPCTIHLSPTQGKKKKK